VSRYRHRREAKWIVTSRRWLINVFASYSAAGVLVVAAMGWVSRGVTRPEFLFSLRDPMLVVEEKAFRMRNADCDVLVFGDSTTMTGVDPRILTADTGLSACNISVTWPVIAMLDTLPIDAYLEHNPRPRYLVLQFTPRAFYDRSDVELNLSLAGPFSMMLRQKGGWPARWFVARHFDLAVQFFWMAFQSLQRPHPERTAEFHRVYDQRLQDFDNNGGLLTLAQPPLAKCSETSQVPHRPPDNRWLTALRAMYQKEGTMVLIKGSPVPDCDPRLRQLQRELGPYLDANVEPLPKEDFVVGGRHMTLRGAEDESHHLAQLLSSR